MDTVRDAGGDPLTKCATCGAWIRRERARCPWCGSAVLSDVDYPDLDLAPDSRDRRYWIRAFGVATLFILATIALLTALGVRQGMEDRRIRNKEAAIEWYEQGRDYMEADRYELAVAAFRESLRLEPDFAAAAQLLAVAEQAAGEPASVSSGPDPPVTTAARDESQLYNEAIAAIGREDWAIAIATLELIADGAPDFRPDEIETALATAHRGAADDALASARYDAAVTHLDAYLAVVPGDAAVLRLRRSISAYAAGIRAYEAGEWTIATDQFRTLYILDPDFMDVAERLAQSHLELGRAFEQREIWCEAAQEYRASIAVRESEQVARLAADAEARCSVRAAPATPTPRPPAIAPTTVPVASPTLVVSATAGLAPTFTPLPTATPGAGGLAYRLDGPVTATFDDACGGHYIRGIVRAADGAPLADVTVLAIDEFGNQRTGVSKSEPLGAYNIPIPSDAISYEVRVIAGGESLSRPVLIQHTPEFSGLAEACHMINWRRSR